MEEKGLYEKFRVERTDGQSAEGGKHYGCSYFVLDLDHDKFALPALEAYAEACKDSHPALYGDLRVAIARMRENFRLNDAVKKC